MPRTGKAIKDDSLLAAALEGLELQRRRIEDQIQEVRLLLGKGTGRRGRPPAVAGHTNGPRRMSAAARRRIGAAQKRRWAEYRKSNGRAE